MPATPHEQIEIRNYLLGKIINRKERQKIEQCLMLDDDYFLEFSIQEEELAQDYADGYLNEEEILSFKIHFLISEERFWQVKFAILLRRYIDEQTTIEKQETFSR